MLNPKATFVLQNLSWDWIVGSFGYSSANILKYFYCVDFSLPHLDHELPRVEANCLDTPWAFSTSAKKGLSLPMCHVASARRMALKLGLLLWGGGGGFQAPGPKSGGRDMKWKEESEKRKLGGAPERSIKEGSKGVRLTCVN